MIELSLDRRDILQLLDGLKARAEEWESTAQTIGSNCSQNPQSVVLECASADEAIHIGRGYRQLITNIETQVMAQLGKSNSSTGRN